MGERSVRDALIPAGQSFYVHAAAWLNLFVLHRRNWDGGMLTQCCIPEDGTERLSALPWGTTL